MNKIRAFAFKIYIFLLICFCIFFIFFFVLYLKDKVLNNLFSTKERYSSTPHTNMIGQSTYFKEFDLGGIKSIFFKALYINAESEDFKALKDSEREELIASHPSFTLSFKIVDKGRLMKFKNVIFDGVDARLYNYKITKPEFNSSDVPYFQIVGSNDLDRKYLKEYSVKVVNNLTITLNEALFKALREQVGFKITLVSHDDVEYSIETVNFLSEERYFDILH
ncbi:hypothetical protein A0V01_04955 (plasmid) [Borrelia hermsii]|uniref:Protein BptA n=1 Tax=Borrelia hermsii TaxID=140 RepID=A0AAN0X6C0_BORHE|nr:hypothetical protein [Borrelia hermsii]AMR75964.1 hypothetical protein A0V01_04955 [Borrelia hermsii]UPA08562.1 hypothetical protein bhDAH_001273 [Borrelia hermsii DAH]